MPSISPTTGLTHCDVFGYVRATSPIDPTDYLTGDGIPMVDPLRVPMTAAPMTAASMTAVPMTAVPATAAPLMILQSATVFLERNQDRHLRTSTAKRSSERIPTFWRESLGVNEVNLGEISKTAKYYVEKAPDTE